ncbi:MAG: hypothetical protein RIC85_03945 [Gammaproteobacteria bacterium]
MTAPPPSPVRFHPKLAEVYRQKVEDLTEALADPTIRDEAFAIIRGLIQEVVISPGENQSFEVELVGEITKMLALPDGKTSFDECSVKVVAGGRFALDRPDSDQTAGSTKVVAGARSQLYLLFEKHGLYVQS